MKRKKKKKKGIKNAIKHVYVKDCITTGKQNRLPNYVIVTFELLLSETKGFLFHI